MVRMGIQERSPSALHSMTGFARMSGETLDWSWAWELKSVNGKGLDIRVRLPAGFEFMESAARGIIASCATRGSINATLNITTTGVENTIIINEALAQRYLSLAHSFSNFHGLPLPTGAEILSLRGVVEGNAALSEEVRAALEAELVSGLQEAANALRANRAEEGAKLGALFADLLERIALAHAAAEEVATTQPTAVQKRMQAQLEVLLSGDKRVDPDRLAQEVALIAVKADVREELDRLKAHIDQARTLLTGGGAVGRKLDFLAQELNREATTLCNKAVTVELNQIGLDLKALIDQLREQIQNVE